MTSLTQGHVANTFSQILFGQFLKFYPEPPDDVRCKDLHLISVFFELLSQTET